MNTSHSHPTLRRLTALGGFTLTVVASATETQPAPDKMVEALNQAFRQADL